LAINGRRHKLKRETFVALGKNLGMSDLQIEKSFKRFHETLGTAFDFFKKSLLPPETKAKYIKLIQERMMRLGL